GRGVGDYSAQEKALDASLNAADGPNALNYTVWTYCPDSSHAWGDGWNMEDLSLWSADDMSTPRSPLYAIGRSDTRGNESEAGLMKKSAPFGVTSTVVTAANSTLSLAQSEPRMTNVEAAGWRSNPYDFLTDGARAVRAFCRPWPIALVGTQKELAFDIAKAHFKLVVVSAAGPPPPWRTRRIGRRRRRAPASEIFVPLVHYADERLLADGHRSRQSAESASISSLGSARSPRGGRAHRTRRRSTSGRCRPRST
ncbi:hypothetical protein B0H14DRAFT_2352702, partial [Mycena olivaceomarginata]